MHEPVKVNVEDYLAGSESLPREFTEHLMVCNECRQEIAVLKEQSMLVQLLRAGEEFEPRPGFYARVIERIESQKTFSIWSIFLQPAFGRRLAVASALLAVLMGIFLVSSEPGSASIQTVATDRQQQVILPGEDEPGPVLGAGQDQDRGAILVNLATYQEQ